MTPHQSQDSEGMIQRLTRLEVARSDEDTIDWITGSQDATEDIAVPIRNRKMRSEITIVRMQDAPTGLGQRA